MNDLSTVAFMRGFFDQSTGTLTSQKIKKGIDGLVDGKEDGKLSSQEEAIFRRVAQSAGILDEEINKAVAVGRGEQPQLDLLPLSPEQERANIPVFFSLKQSLPSDPSFKPGPERTVTLRYNLYQHSPVVIDDGKGASIQLVAKDHEPVKALHFLSNREIVDSIAYEVKMDPKTQLALGATLAGAARKDLEKSAASRNDALQLLNEATSQPEVLEKRRQKTKKLSPEQREIVYLKSLLADKTNPIVVQSQKPGEIIFRISSSRGQFLATATILRDNGSLITYSYESQKQYGGEVITTKTTPRLMTAAEKETFREALVDPSAYGYQIEDAMGIVKKLRGQ